MRTEIAKAFYDKEVYLIDKRTEMDAEGGVTTKGYTVKESFKGNVNFSNCEKIQEDYGLDYKIDVSLTTDYTGLKKDDIFAYNKLLYTVKGIYPRDSHSLILGALWRP